MEFPRSLTDLVFKSPSLDWPWTFKSIVSFESGKISLIGLSSGLNFLKLTILLSLSNTPYGKSNLSSPTVKSYFLFNCSGDILVNVILEVASSTYSGFPGITFILDNWASCNFYSFFLC